jgi:hypothetical protein
VSPPEIDDANARHEITATALERPLYKPCFLRVLLRDCADVDEVVAHRLIARELLSVPLRR